MKKLIAVLILMFIAMPAAAFEPPSYALYSGVYTADQASIVSVPGYFYGIAVMTDGTNNCTVVTYDNTAASGTNKLHPDWVVTTSGTDRAKVYAPPSPVAYNTGISVDITTSGTCSYQVLYRRR